ncbi:hypothetical protein Ais01nite_59010 [Asanoa ishikariensis]|nr:hypothetical protein Ais01nite_59010 [Asanoa ishikariensis]
MLADGGGAELECVAELGGGGGAPLQQQRQHAVAGAPISGDGPGTGRLRLRRQHRDVFHYHNVTYFHRREQTGTPVIDITVSGWRRGGDGRSLSYGT